MTSKVMVQITAFSNASTLNHQEPNEAGPPSDGVSHANRKNMPT